MLWCGLKLVMGVLVLEPLGRGCDAGQDHPLPVPCLRPFGMSYKVISRWLSLVLGLEVPGRDKIVNQGWLPLMTTWGLLRKRYRACQWRCCLFGIYELLRDFNNFTA